MGFVVQAEAITAETEECSYFWTTSFASATDDAPDYIYCRLNKGQYYLQSASNYAQFAPGADDITITYDTLSPDGTTTVGSFLAGVTNTTTICANTGPFDLNVHVSDQDDRGFSTGGIYYHQVLAIADADKNGFGMTPIRYFKLTVTEASANASCAVAHSTVSWLRR